MVAPESSNYALEVFPLSLNCSPCDSSHYSTPLGDPVENFSYIVSYITATTKLRD